MSLSVDIHLIFALLLALNCLVDSESQHFCKSFRQNGDQIGYHFRRIFPQNEPNRNHDIIINGRYWRLKFTDEESPLLRFLNINKGEESPFFSDNYSMATTLWFKYNKKEYEYNYALLFSKNNWTAVKVGEIPGDDYKDDKPLTDYKELSSAKYGATNCYTYVMGYDFDYSEFYGIRKYNYPHIEAIEQLLPYYEVIVIAPQWGHSADAMGYLFLFKDGLQIKWCWSRANQLDTKSCNESPQLLVDCSSDEWVIPKLPDPSTTPPTSRIWLNNGFLGILVVVVIFLIAFMLWFISSKLNQTEDPSCVDQDITGVDIARAVSKKITIRKK